MPSAHSVKLRPLEREESVTSVRSHPVRNIASKHGSNLYFTTVTRE